jgi:hypothetical protein
MTLKTAARNPLMTLTSAGGRESEADAIWFGNISVMFSIVNADVTVVLTSFQVNGIPRR